MVRNSSPAFARYIGIDYSGAKTPDHGLPGLRVYLASEGGEPGEVRPPSGGRRHWTRRGLAEWLVERLAEGEPALMGIDHSFSFPRQYFDKYRLPPDWPLFLEDFLHHWPTDRNGVSVDSVRKGLCGVGKNRSGEACWRRLSEQRCSAKSVFHFDVPGQVAKSTHAGLPWLLYLRRRLGKRVHFWPFDGWTVPEGRSALVEVYPRLWKTAFAMENRTPDQQDAFAAAGWLQQSDREGSLRVALAPDLSPGELETAAFEGWIVGVP